MDNSANCDDLKGVIMQQMQSMFAGINKAQIRIKNLENSLKDDSASITTNLTNSGTGGNPFIVDSPKSIISHS